MVRGLPQLFASSVTCTDCINGKQHRDPIPKKSTWRATQKLELIHADICGPITPTSNSNKRYILLFIDDYSRKAWVYFLVEKSKAFNYFKCFKTMVEKETGLFVKCLRTDRGGEFNSNEFNDFCKQSGIKRQLTTAYTPQQNGVAERKNRTVMNMVRSMLSDKNIPKNFWPEAVNWTIHVLNRCPTLAVKDVTPEETWSGVKPSVDHFRVFGCIAHVHVPEERRTKLDNRSITCVILGVSEESKGYRLFDPVAKRVVVSRDVIFEEEKQWDWDVSYEKQIVVDLEWGDGDGENEEGVRESGNRENIDGEVGGTRDTEVREDEDSSSEGEERVRELRQSRERQPPTWMGDYVSGEGLSEDEVHMALVESTDPLHFEEAVKSANWRLAMNNEIKSIEKNQTWTLTELPAGAKRIGVKWVYKTKYNEHGKIDKYKARLVAKGYSQKYGVDYTEVFAPVARMDTIRMIIALAAQKNWTIFQLDVKSAFLHGELSEDVYVEQPRGYEKKGNEHLVYKLHKALYGLKQAPRAWFSRIEAHFIGEGFRRCDSEQTLFTKKSREGKILIFDMSDLGKMRFFLGIEVLQKSDGIYICQRKYALEVLRRFGMMESNSVGSPIVPGFKISKDENGDSVDETYYKQLGLNYGIHYKKGGDGELLTFTDSDYAGDMEDRKSTSGYVFLMSSCAVSWCSKKQPVVTLSTTEAEFVAAAVCACQGVWMKRILKELGHSNGSCTTVMCDNSSTIKLSKNPVTKEGTIELVHCGSQDQVADIMTKPLKLEVFQKLRKLLGVCEISGIN
ncbi:unnamed protein product [Prunus armeniaca]